MQCRAAEGRARQRRTPSLTFLVISQKTTAQVNGTFPFGGH
jgi:hypothetical protein